MSMLKVRYPSVFKMIFFQNRNEDGNRPRRQKIGMATVYSQKVDFVNKLAVRSCPLNQAN